MLACIRCGVEMSAGQTSYVLDNESVLPPPEELKYSERPKKKNILVTAESYVVEAGLIFMVAITVAIIFPNINSRNCFCVMVAAVAAGLITFQYNSLFGKRNA